MEYKKYAHGIIFLIENCLGKQGGIKFQYEWSDDEFCTLGSVGTEINYSDIREFVDKTLYAFDEDIIPHYYKSGEDYYIENC